jgi:2-haloacid dehalogenase
MPINRRQFLSLATAGIALGAGASQLLDVAAERSTIRALAFDFFAVFDSRPVFTLSDELFPGKGAELSNAWRTKQFEYQWLRALSGHYADFWQATDDALVFAANMLKLELSPRKRNQLMESYLQLKVWPDVPSVLRSLKDAGVRLALLSNATAKILRASIRNSNLQDTFEHVLSTDSLRTYKPDQRAYQMAVDAFALSREEIGFVAFAGWDVAGAKWFGYPTFWVNRLNLPGEELGVAPDLTRGSLVQLLDFLDLQG